MRNNTKNECWFCGRETIMSYFFDVVANLVEVDSTNIKNAKHSMQKIVDIESCDVHKKRHTDNHWLFKNDVSFKTHLNNVWKRYKSNYAQFQK